MHEHVFVDESKARGFVLVAVAVPSDELTAMRALVRSLRHPGSDRSHFSAESDGQRKKILAAYRSVGIHATVYDARRISSEITAREVAIAQLADDAIKMGAKRLVLEADDPAVKSDRRIIFERLRNAGAELDYCHMKARAECLLEVPDAVAWSWAKGHHWKRLAHQLIADVVELRQP